MKLKIDEKIQLLHGIREGSKTYYGEKSHRDIIGDPAGFTANDVIQSMCKVLNEIVNHIEKGDNENGR